MNSTEKQMLDLLKKGRDCLGFTAVRAEFEAEGVSNDELMRLTEIGYKAGLDLYLKIGGCEAISDLIMAKQAGASAIIAPMIESTYALEKFASARTRIFQTNTDVEFYYNIETLQAYTIRQDLIKRAGELGLTGVVFGRVDFVGSQGLSRQTINEPKTTAMVIETADYCKKFDQNFILGGGISVEAVSAISEIASVHLTRFETRKIAFDSHIIESPALIQSIIEASRFELLWLKNKQNYYMTLQQEELRRIQMLESRVTSIAA